MVLGSVRHSLSELQRRQQLNTPSDGYLPIMAQHSILLICTGNICRSALAAPILSSILIRCGVEDFAVSSAASTPTHSGRPAHRAAIAVAQRKGLDLSRHRAQFVGDLDLSGFSMILAIDRENYRSLLGLIPPHLHDRIKLLMSFTEGWETPDIPDPCLRPDSLVTAIDMIEDASFDLASFLLDLPKGSP